MSGTSGKGSLATRRARNRAAAIETPAAIRLAKTRSVLGTDCPYEPVGFDHDLYYVIDAQHQLRPFRPRDIGRQWLVSICDRVRWLQERYPRTLKGKPVLGFAVEKAAEELLQACHIMGFWTQSDQIRGRGAWIGEDGDLILHRGDHLIIGKRELCTGRHGEFVYPRRKSLSPMDDEPQPEGADGAASELLGRLDTFAWGRGTFDSLLMLGWICCAMVAGALKFRPHCFLTGEFSAGKSTLQLLLQCVFGPEGIISVSDTSAAGLWQSFGFDTLPAGIDELEAEEDLSRQRALIKLIRQASSGGLILRGDSQHHGAQFRVCSAFCCSAIVPPPMPSADLSRFHVFTLITPPAGTEQAPFSTDRLDAIGRGVLRRVVQEFARLSGDVMPRIRAYLVKLGYPRRTADLYAPLFGAADVALYDVFDLARIHEWCAHRFMRTILADVLADQIPEARRCLDYLFSSRIDPRRQDSPAIGELLAAVAHGLRAHAGHAARLPFDGAADDAGELANGQPYDDAQHRLLGIGLRIRAEPGGAGEPPRLLLLVANSHNGLAEMFKNTPWQTTSNAAGGGGWSHVLRRVPGAESPKGAVRFRPGVQSRAVVLPMEAVFSDAGRQPAASPQTAAETPDKGASVH